MKYTYKVTITATNLKAENSLLLETYCKDLLSFASKTVGYQYFQCKGLLRSMNDSQIVVDTIVNTLIEAEIKCNLSIDIKLTNTNYNFNLDK